MDLTGIGTLIAAAVTAWMAYEVRRQVSLARREQQSAVRPVLVRAGAGADDIAWDRNCVTLTVRNIGTGPAFNIEAKVHHRVSLTPGLPITAPPRSVVQAGGDVELPFEWMWGTCIDSPALNGLLFDITYQDVSGVPYRTFAQVEMSRNGDRRVTTDHTLVVDAEAASDVGHNLVTDWYTTYDQLSGHRPEGYVGKAFKVPSGGVDG